MVCLVSSLDMKQPEQVDTPGPKKKKTIPTLKEEDDLQAKIDNYLDNLEIKQANEESKKRAERIDLEDEPSMFSVFDERPYAKMMSVLGAIWFVFYFLFYKSIFCTWRDHEIRKIELEHRKRIAKKKAHA